MRRRKTLPSWLFPALFCVAAVAGGVLLKLHFDDLIATDGSELRAVDAGRMVQSRGLTESDRSGDPAPGELAAATEPDVDAAAESATATATGSAEDDPDTAVDADIDQVVGSSIGSTDVEPEPVFVADKSVWVDPASSGRPWNALGATEGLLTFRGNPTRSYYGEGPLPIRPRVQWTFNIGCSQSPVGGVAKQWCGSGWTGQPAVFRLPTTGEWTVAFGAYNRAVNFLDPVDGSQALAPYVTNDIIKGTITIDPDGFPLLYTGSRDDYFHVVALDRERPTALWQLSADDTEQTLWNNDWDGSALVIDDHLFVGGENSRFYIVKLNRSYAPDGTVAVDPVVVFSTEAWDDELLANISNLEVSVENSVAISGDTVYFANSAGLVQGWSIGGVDDGATPERVFRFWTGDDTDATIAIDDEGMLYVGSQYERGNARSQEVGQIIKLDPSRPDDPLVWSRSARAGLGSGIWATPALYGDLVIVATNEGEVLGIDRATGEDRWQLPLEGPLWSSPVIVDDVLIQADCGGNINAFDLLIPDPEPLRLWSIHIGGCIESTPAVWGGQIFVGTRSGTFFAIG